MARCLFACIIYFSSLAAFAQDTIETIELSARKPGGIDFFSAGMDYLHKEAYTKADSLFTRSLDAGDRTIETYFNRAMTRRHMGNSCGFCVDMLCAAELGDKEANSVFWQNCLGPDSLLTCMKNLRVVLNDTVATMTDFDSVSNTKRVSVIQQVAGLSKRYLINAKGKTETFKLDDPAYDLMGILEQPEFPGGDKELFLFLQKNIQYPPAEKNKRTEGKVYVSFIIDRDGSVTDVDVYKGINGAQELTEEALRVVKLMPKWKPGKKNNERVRVKYIIPVYFRLV